MKLQIMIDQCYLDDSLTIRLEPELRNDRKLNLCAQWEHDLLIPDHAVTSLLLGMVNTSWKYFILTQFLMKKLKN